MKTTTEENKTLPRRLEMRRSLLAILVGASLGLAGCGGNERAATDEAPAPEQPAARAPSPELRALLAANGEVQGWAMVKAPRAFDADSLYELIDGAAESFIAYGVREVVAADYRQSGSNHEAVIEVYLMKDPLNAFGKYSEERYPDYKFLEVGNEGYSGGSTLNFWKGPYYVKITAPREDEALQAELAKLARSIAGKIATPGAEPAELSWFPKENQVSRGAKYLPKDVLAQSYFTGGFEAQYKGGGKEWKLVLIPLESAAAASEGLRRYREAVAAGGKGGRGLQGLGEGAFVAADRFYGTIVAGRRDRYVAAALGATEDAGRKQVADVLRNAK